MLAILVSQNNETAAMLCPKPIVWELNSFLMQTLSFVPINLHRCWPREYNAIHWKEGHPACCQWDFPHHCRSFNSLIPPSCLLLLFQLSYVTVSRPCCLLEHRRPRRSMCHWMNIIINIHSVTHTTSGPPVVGILPQQGSTGYKYHLKCVMLLSFFFTHWKLFKMDYFSHELALLLYKWW